MSNAYTVTIRVENGEGATSVKLTHCDREKLIANPLIAAVVRMFEDSLEETEGRDRRDAKFNGLL
jgi:hypothetical protein